MMKALFFIILIILGLVGLVTLLFFPTEFAAKVKELIGKQKNKNNAPDADVHHPCETSPGATPFIEASDDSMAKVKEQFIKKQDKFFGIFENLFLVAQAGAETEQCNLNDWETRILSLSNVAELQNYWRSVRNRPSEFLDFVFSCGVVRDDCRILTASETTHYRYYDLDGSAIVPQQEYEVLQPSWHNGEILLEKGILKKI